LKQVITLLITRLPYWSGQVNVTSKNFGSQVQFLVSANAGIAQLVEQKTEIQSRLPGHFFSIVHLKTMHYYV